MKGNTKIGDINDDDEDDNDNVIKGSGDNIDTQLDWRKFGAITEIKGNVRISKDL